MRRIEAIGESRIKRHVDHTWSMWITPLGSGESLVAPEEFVRQRCFCEVFCRVGARSRAGALVVFLACVPAMPRAEPLACPQTPEQGDLRHALSPRAPGR